MVFLVPGFLKRDCAVRKKIGMRIEKYFIYIEIKIKKGIW